MLRTSISEPILQETHIFTSFLYEKLIKKPELKKVEVIKSADEKVIFDEKIEEVINIDLPDLPK